MFASSVGIEVASETALETGISLEDFAEWVLTNHKLKKVQRRHQLEDVALSQSIPTNDNLDDDILVSHILNLVVVARYEFNPDIPDGGIT